MGYLSLLIIGLLAGYKIHLGNLHYPSKAIKNTMVVSRNVDMPALSSTMTEGKIVSWNKKVGDKVVAGDVLPFVSDKADMDVLKKMDILLQYTPQRESLQQ
jgi:pyruvate dehydrogenase E2 component (dihydrolipoamide acetyltransferase)